MLSAIINNWKNIQHQNEKTMIKQDQQEQLSIMTEENYHDVKYMLDSFECIVDGDFCTINQSKEDDSLAEDVKCLKDISYNHGCNQYSTIETLNLVKSKLEDLKELQSRDIITKAIISIKEKFRKIFYK
jgi:hypothetical protein